MTTERALFHAYRNTQGTYASECACGGLIEADKPEDVPEAINLHNESTVHAQWSGWQEAVHALQRPVRKPCPCHGHTAEISA